MTKCEKHPKARRIKVAVCIDNRIVGERERCATCYTELAWVSGKEDFDYWIRTGRLKRGLKNGSSKM